MKLFLFIGGQHHGHMLPVCEQSLSDPTDPPRRSPDGDYYAGYRLLAIRRIGGGIRQVFVQQRYLGDRQRLSDYLTDGLAEALDNYERVFRHHRDHPRTLVPLNETGAEERGRPAELVPRQAQKLAEISGSGDFD